MAARVVVCLAGLGVFAALAGAQGTKTQENKGQEDSKAQVEPAHVEQAGLAPALAARRLSANPFVLENPKRLEFPSELARRIYEETVREVLRQVNADHAPNVQLNLTVRVGEPGSGVKTLHQPEQRTVISLRQWDEWTFARLVSRAVRDSLLSEEELDDAADAALRKIRSEVAVQDLRSEKR